MASLSFVVTCGTGVNQLSASVPQGQAVDGWAYVSIQGEAANTGVAYFGGAYPGPNLSATGVYGQRIEAPTSSIPAAPSIIELPRGNINLAEHWLKGTSGEKYTIHCIGG